MYLQIMYLLYFSCPAMGIGQTQGTFYVPKQPHIVQRLPITLTQAEQQVYNAVMNSNASATTVINVALITQTHHH